MVVDNIGQMICRQIIGRLIEHLVVEYVAHDSDLAADQVIDLDLLARLDLKADHILIALVNKPLDLLLGHSQRIAH